MSLSDEIQLPRLDSLADIPYAQEAPASWDPDYRKIWQELQVANRNKTQLGGHIRELRSRLSQSIAQRDEGLAREAELVEALRQAKCHIANAQFALSKGNPSHGWLPHIRQGLYEAKASLAKHGCADGEKAE